LKRSPHGSITAIACLCLVGGLALSSGPLYGDFRIASTHPVRELVFPDDTGAIHTFTPPEGIDLQNAFFRSLGTNGRACITCHQPQLAWTITPAHVQARFEATGGQDPLFRTNDGSNSPQADVSTIEARRSAYSMLLNRAVIRVGLGIPDGAEFDLVAVDDPYGFASAKELSLFRRPLPSTNLRFLSGVMWDGRETVRGQSMEQNLLTQSDHATLGHAQAAHSLTPEQQQQIVQFETGIYTAQAIDNAAGVLAQGAAGGPTFLSSQEFYLGINDPLGLNPTGAPFNPSSFTLYTRWENPENLLTDVRAPARQAVASGQKLFNTKKINITGVSGLNDELHLASIQGTCTTCHDSPNVGNHSVAAPLNIGLADATRRTPDLPLYTLGNKTTGETVQTTDPGRALVTGKWKDIGRFKGPILRGLAARAPYFHNGSAAALDDVVKFYDTRFEIKLTPEEKADLVAFLRTL
jgi:cytochrome c peroxidase